MTVAQCPLIPHGTFRMTRRQRVARALMHDRLLGRTRIRRHFVAMFRDDANGPVDATLFGLKARFHPHDNQTDAKGAVCGNAYNSAELRWLRKALRPGHVFLDIGANMGFFSLFAATRGARVVALEANPILQARIKTNFAFNNLPLTLLEGAVGDVRQMVRMAPRDEDLGSSQVEPGEGARIPMRPLLDYLREADIYGIDVLKIDIEGHEDRALLPFFRDAPSWMHPRYIIMEHATDPARGEALNQGLVESGLYRVLRRSRANALLSRCATVTKGYQMPDVSFAASA